MFEKVSRSLKYDSIFFGPQTHVRVPGKRDLIAHTMIFYSIDICSAITPKNNSPDKTFLFVSVVSPTLCIHVI